MSYFKRMIDEMLPVTKHLILINIIVWLAMQVPGIAQRVEMYGALYYVTCPNFNVAQLFTYMFIHANFMHLFFNMFALFMFGPMLERVFGSQRFLFYYLSCGVGAALIQLGVFAVMVSHYSSILPPEVVEMAQHGRYLPIEPASFKLAALINTPIVGASGAVYGILLGFAMLFPNLPLYIMFIPVPVKAKWVVIGYAVIELFQAVSNNPGDNVAHVAHLGGMIVGLIIILIWRRTGTLRKNGFY